MNATASRLSRRFLRAVIPSSGHAGEKDRRAFTSTKTSTVPSTATMSISPSRHRQFRVMILYPRRFRNLAAALSPRRPIMSGFRLGRCIWPHLVGAPAAGRRRSGLLGRFLFGRFVLILLGLVPLAKPPGLADPVAQEVQFCAPDHAVPQDIDLHDFGRVYGEYPLHALVIHDAPDRAGHVGAAIVRALAELPCRVTWVDERDPLIRIELPRLEQDPVGDPDLPDIVIGVVKGHKYKERCISLENEDTCFIYSDGITDLVNDRDESFGDERLAEFLLRHQDDNVSRLCENMFRALVEFRGAAPQFDDITMVALKIRE